MLCTTRLYLLVLTMLSGAQPVFAQLAVVRGTISDSATGRSIAGAFIAAVRSERAGRERSGVDGRYVLDRIPPGVTELEFHCPSGTLLGWPVEVRPIQLRAGQDTVVNVRVSATACGEPPYSERKGVFRGRFSYGFESSSFAPCLDASLGLSQPRPTGVWFGERIWVRVDSVIASRLLEMAPNVAPDSMGNLSYFVRWQGVLKGPGTYRHMGIAGYLMEVDTVYLAVPRNERSC